MRKVNLAVIRPWVAKKIIELVGFEDELVVEYAVGLLEDESQPVRSTCVPPNFSNFKYVATGPRPTKNANQPDWLPDQGHT